MEKRSRGVIYTVLYGTHVAGRSHYSCAAVDQSRLVVFSVTAVSGCQTGHAYHTTLTNLRRVSVLIRF